MQVIQEDIDLHTLYDPEKSMNGVEKVFVLDGQQRLQTLYCIYSGSILNPKTNNQEEAYFDVTGSKVNDASGQIYNLEFFPNDAPQQLPLFRIKNLVTVFEKRSAEEISDEINEKLDALLSETGEAKKARERTVRRNMSLLRSILTEDVHFWVEELDGVANNYPYKAILEIFVRVNSGGTKLDASDLMFAAMKELSASIEENLEEVAVVLSNGGLKFEVDTVLKCILLVNGSGAIVDPSKFSGLNGSQLVATIDANWDSKYLPAFYSLRDFIANDLRVDNYKVIRSYNSLVPVFEYLYHNNAPTPANKSRLKAFYYKSQLFNWFSSQTDSVLDYLHNNFLRDCSGKDFPLGDIANYFSSNRKHNIKFDKAVLLDHSLRFFFLHILYVEMNGSSAFNVTLKNNAPHIDHIYPKSKLGKDPFNLMTPDINHIGNYRFVGGTDNIRKRAEIPSSYFSKLKADGVDISRHLLVDEYVSDPAKLGMNLSDYKNFRDKRTQAIFDIIEPKINFA